MSAPSARKKSIRPITVYEAPGESELFGDSIDKFANAAMQFAVTQATHNQRLNGIDTTVKNLQEDVRNLRETQQEQHQYLNKRVDKVHEDLSQRINDIDHKLDTQTVTLSKHIDDGMAGLGKRLQSVETWRYIIMGGALVVTFIVGDVLVRVFGDIFLDTLKKVL